MTPAGKRMAKYAAVGAIIAIPIPIVGPIIGGIVGAVIAHNKNKKLGGSAY
jgi:glycerol uptake facilitator-like aquaporin